jgi:hypothetical protein
MRKALRLLLSVLWFWLWLDLAHGLRHWRHPKKGGAFVFEPMRLPHFHAHENATNTTSRTHNTTALWRETVAGFRH